MRRFLWFRLIATLLAAWLPLVSGEPGLLQPCPMHGAERLVLASLRGEALLAPAHQTAHGHHHAGAAEKNDAPGSSHAGHGCSCIDGCTAAGSAFVAPAAPAQELVATEWIETATLHAVESLPRPGPDHARPHSTGPPRA